MMQPEPDSQLLFDGFDQLVSTEHLLLLVDDEGRPDVDFDIPNGLLAATPNGVMIQTGSKIGRIAVRVRITTARTVPQFDDWDDISEVSTIFSEGGAFLQTFDDASEELGDCSGGLIGSVCVRVSVRGRDSPSDGLQTTEEYFLEAWPAPAAPPVDLVLRDRCGRNYRYSLTLNG